MDVSIIMPTYNVEKYVGEAIESVLSQVFSGSYELLIADDCSSDSTPDILKSYQAKYPDIIKVIFRKHNIGANPNSYNLCMCASGRYMAFIDADDLWLTTDKLQNQIDFLEKHNGFGAVCSNAYYIDDKGVKSKKASETKEGLISFNEMIYGHNDIFCSSFVCRSNLYRKMADDCTWYIDKGCFNDTVWAFWLSYHNLLYLMQTPFSAYRVLSNSACHSTDKKKQILLGKRYFMKKICFLFQNDYPIEDKMDIISKEYNYIVNNALYEGEMKVRKTKTFKIGKRIKALINIFKCQK